MVGINIHSHVKLYSTLAQSAIGEKKNKLYKGLFFFHSQKYIHANNRFSPECVKWKQSTIFGVLNAN